MDYLITSPQGTYLQSPEENQTQNRGEVREQRPGQQEQTVGLFVLQK